MGAVSALNQRPPPEVQMAVVGCGHIPSQLHPGGLPEGLVRSRRPCGAGIRHHCFRGGSEDAEPQGWERLGWSSPAQCQL